MLKCANAMESVVDSNIDKVMKQEECCTCEKCRMDVRAITLNSLPPRYVVTEAGMTLEACLHGYGQNHVLVYQRLLEAIQKVKKSPRHEDDKKTLSYY